MYDMFILEQGCTFDKRCKNRTDLNEFELTEKEKEGKTSSWARIGQSGPTDLRGGCEAPTGERERSGPSPVVPKGDRTREHSRGTA